MSSSAGVTVQEAEVVFGGSSDLDDNYNASLTLSNPADRPIAYKIKTTAPKNYVVKPASGILDPDETRQIRITAAAVKFRESLEERRKDRFMVQIFFALPGMKEPVAKHHWANDDATYGTKKLQVNLRELELSLTNNDGGVSQKNRRVTTSEVTESSPVQKTVESNTSPRYKGDMNVPSEVQPSVTQFHGTLHHSEIVVGDEPLTFSVFQVVFFIIAWTMCLWLLGRLK